MVDLHEHNTSCDLNLKICWSLKCITQSISLKGMSPKNPQIAVLHHKNWTYHGLPGIVILKCPYFCKKKKKKSIKLLQVYDVILINNY